MKKLKILLSFIIVLLLCMNSLAFAVPNGDTQEPPSLSAQSAILIDGKSGMILYGKDMGKKMYPASTTKIITYMVIEDAISNGDIALDDMLTFPQELYDKLDPGGSNIALRVGEKMSVENLISGMLIASGNDAATLLAVSTAGSEAEFVKKMNKKAEELGLKNTHFTNPHGLTDEQHYTTASDLAVAAKAAMKSEMFRKIVGSKTLTIAPTNKTEEQRYYINTNNLVSNLRYSKYYYSKATGIKTGYTDMAGACLVASAKEGERELICVILKSETSHEDAKALLEYGFDNFKELKVASANDILGECKVKQGASGKDHVRAVSGENVWATVPLSATLDDIEMKISYNAEELRAPVAKGSVLGSVTYTYNGTVIATADLIAEEDIARHPLGFLMSFWEALWGSIIFRIILYLILLILFLFLLLVAYGFYRSIKRSRARKRRRAKYRPPMY